MGMAAIWDREQEPFEQTFVPPVPRGCKYETWSQLAQGFQGNHLKMLTMDDYGQQSLSIL